MLASEVWELKCSILQRHWKVLCATTQLLFSFSLEEPPVRMQVKFAFPDLYAVFSQSQEKCKIVMAGVFLACEVL